MSRHLPAPLAWAALLLLSGAAPAQTIEHVVEPGETLWSIAAQSDVYDDPYLWPVIYEFNRDQIVDPRRIYPRQRLQIPTHIDREKRRQARDKALESSRAEGREAP